MIHLCSTRARFYNQLHPIRLLVPRGCCCQFMPKQAFFSIFFKSFRLISRLLIYLIFFRRTRSLNAPSPFQQFGPCGRIMKNSAMVMQIQDPASQRLTWYKPPLAVLVIKKVRDSTVLSPFIQLVEWLIEEKHMVVWVESAVLDDPLLMEDKKFLAVKDKLVTFK